MKWYVVRWVNELTGEITNREVCAFDRADATRRTYWVIGKEYRKVISVHVKK